MNSLSQEQITELIAQQYGYDRQKIRKCELGDFRYAINDEGETVKLYPIDVVIQTEKEMLYFTGRVVLIRTDELESKSYWV